MIDEELGTREGHHVSHVQESTVNHSLWRTSILFTLVTAVIFGLGYPLLMTGLAHILFPRQAAGSLITGKDGTVIGSELIAQSFASDKYFHPRPSAAGNGYDATSSGGTNLAQSNAKLPQRMQADIDKLAAENPGKPVPIDMVTYLRLGSRSRHYARQRLLPGAARGQGARVVGGRSSQSDCRAHSRHARSDFWASRA